MGTGHVMRMIALGQAWQDKGGEVIFLCAEITPALEERLRSEHFSLRRIDAAAGSLRDLKATCSVIFSRGEKVLSVAVDGYQFDAGFQLGLKKSGCRLLAVDDYGHAGAYHADVVLNQNIYAHQALYSKRDSNSKLLLGPKFALLRREFRRQRGLARTVPKKVKKLLVTLGGADADNVTKKVINALTDTGFEVKVVVGGSNPHLRGLLRAAELATRKQTRVELVVNPSDMPGLMRWADLAVAAGGSTAWELACTSLPSIFIILADNQEENVRELERQGFGLNLGNHTALNADLLRCSLSHVASNFKLRIQFSARGQELVDGEGATRVSKLLDLKRRPAKLICKHR